VCLKQKKRGWDVCVTAHQNVHNHPVTKAHCKRYSNIRNVVPETIAKQVRQMRRRNDPRRTIWQFVPDNGGDEMSMKDVHNLMAKMQREDYTADTIEGRVEKFLHDFAREEGNTARVYRTDTVQISGFSRNCVELIMSSLFYCRILLIASLYRVFICAGCSRYTSRCY
jgi:hypothetical protein